MFYWIEDPDINAIYLRLALFSVLAIVGVTLRTKGKESTKYELKPAKKFRQEYEEQKKREMDDRT